MVDNRFVADSPAQKPRLLVAADWFAPGVRAGGPIRSVVNLVNLLGAWADVRVLTGCCDLGERLPYEGVEVNRWLPWKNKARVFYGTAWGRLTEFRRVLREQRPEAVYLNSMFSFPGTLWPLLLCARLPETTRVVLAPRGMLKESALGRKAWKKRPLLKLLRGLGLTKRVVFHATSADELAEIEREFPGARAVLVPNVPQQPLEVLPERPPADGTLRLCCVGRVHPIKNVHLAIESLQGLERPCELTVVGPEEDTGYAAHCRQLANQLPGHLRVKFAGTMGEAQIQQLLIQADAMILSTQGENFGHAIFESLAVGTPVIISDCTIWRDLRAREAGWDLPLGEGARPFADAVRELAMMGVEKREQLRAGALRMAQQFVQENRFLEGYEKMFWG
jgi:glycosyltransferase involved in cell wall biosynthesis